MLAIVLGAFFLAGLGYAAHTHFADKANGTAGHAELCGFCAAHGGLIGPAADLSRPAPVAPATVVLVLVVATALSRRIPTAARPRAPPAR